MCACAECAAKCKREHTHFSFSFTTHTAFGELIRYAFNGSFNSISTAFPHLVFLFFFYFFYPFLSGLHWHFINFYCISRIWSIQFSHKVREVSAFSRFSLSLPCPLSHTLSFSNALRDAFPDGQCWKLITLQLDFCPVTRWKWLQLVAGTEVVLQLFCSVLPLYVRQFSVCPLPQPMRPQLTQLFNWIEAINTQSETEIEIGDGVAWKMSAREEQAKTHPVASLVGAK